VASVPLAARLVEVIADRGESVAARYRYGSGCIVSGRTVLTAAHVVAEAVRVQVRDPQKGLFSATVDPRFVGDPNGPGPDLALLELDDSAVDLPPMGLARLDRDSPTDEPVRCRAVGYPWFVETPSPAAVRDTVDAIGVVPVLSKLAAGLLSVQVRYPPRPLPPAQVRLGESEWWGMSGGPVVAAGRLLGVVVEHGPREGPSAITAIPMTALEQDPAHPGWGSGVKDPSAWWARLGVSGLADLQRLPALPERPPPAYWETMREFGRTLHTRMPRLLHREQDLAKIAAFATGRAGYRWLVGGAYAGKTALVYEAVTAGLPEEVEVDVVCYFLSRRASDADSSRFLAAVVPQLAYLCELDPPVADRDQFYALWGRAAERAAETGRPLLLVVDGLDEDIRPTGLPSVASLLPTQVEGRAHVLVTSRPHPELPTGVPDGHPIRSPSIRVDLKPFEGAEELAELARQEIHNLTHGADSDIAADALGLLTAAAGPLSEEDLAFLSNDLAAPSAAHSWRVYHLVTEQAARSLEPVGPAEQPRYQFAHSSLLEYTRADKVLSRRKYRDRIHQWAERWRDRGWPTSWDGIGSTPRYLLDSYPGTLASEPSRLAALVSDVGWVDAAIQSMGADLVLADLRTAAPANPAEPAVEAMLATVSGQAHHLRPSVPLTWPGYVLRQLWMQAAELKEDHLAGDLRARLQSQPDPGLIPIWTTRRASRALLAELGRHGEPVSAVAVLPDGRVVSAGEDGRVLVWDPARPGSGPVQLGRHDGPVDAVAVLRDGRVVSGGRDHWVLVWDPSRPGSGPVKLGRHGEPVRAVAVLPDGRVVSGGDDDRVLVWDPSQPGSDPVELGRWVFAVAALPDGRVVSGGVDGWVLVWDPARRKKADPVKLGRHDGPVGALAVVPDGRVVSGGVDGWVLVWDPARRKKADPVKLGRHNRRVNAVAVLPDGRVVSGGDDSRLLVWDPARPKAGPVKLGRHYDWVAAVAALRDGRVVSGGEDERLLVWDPARQKKADPVELGSHYDWVTAVAVLPDGRVVSGGRDGRVLVWDPARRKKADPVELGRHDNGVTALAVLPDGRVVSGGHDHRVLVWDPSRPGSGPVELGRHNDVVTAVAVLPDGRVVSGGGDDRVLIWSVATQRQVAQLGCSVIGLAGVQARRGEASLVVIHAGQGFSLWSTAKDDNESF